MATDETNRIDAMPTKEFFIDMLVRDVPLIRAIIDLIDNSVDGAIRSGRSDYKDYWILINVDNDRFTIKDNCGGISIDIAKNYAFRFGRPKNAGPTPKSIGQFGVGMKRTIFKLGKAFKIESVTNNSSFKMDVNVAEWEKTEEWKFDFTEINEDLDNVKHDDIGTNIEISDLHESVKESFSSDNFKKELSQELERAHYVNMDMGLSITFNGVPLKSNPLLLLHSDSIKPAYHKEIYFENTSAPVTVQIYVGISDRELHDGGWYIFCNGRMVLESDQSITTGWGEGGGKVMPQYHGDFAFFRGYVFFESSNAGLLPWTTTKTGVDTDLPLYKSVRLSMISQMRPVINFLRKLAKETKESKEDETERFLEQAIGDATPSKFFEVDVNSKFEYPETLKVKRTPAKKRIQYDIPIKKFERAKKSLNARSIKEVGEKTFNYYYAMECED